MFFVPAHAFEGEDGTAGRMLVQAAFVEGFDPEAAALYDLGIFSFADVVVKKLSAAETEEQGEAADGSKLRFAVPGFGAGWFIAFLFGRRFNHTVFSFNVDKILVDKDSKLIGCELGVFKLHEFMIKMPDGIKDNQR